MANAKLVTVRIQRAGAKRQGQWTEGYMIICPNGTRLQPMTKSEARLYCKSKGWFVDIMPRTYADLES